MTTAPPSPKRRRNAPMAAPDAPIPEVTYSSPVPGSQLTVRLPEDAIRGLIAPFEGRARSVLVGLLQGMSIGQAAMAAGITSETVHQWRKRPEFGKAVEAARDWGYRGTYEAELRRRAMAGPDDRGSMRALEMVVKAEDAAYRDKAQLAVSVLHMTEQSMAAFEDGYALEPDQVSETATGRLVDGVAMVVDMGEPDDLPDVSP